ncbi:hypothetical protein EC968_004830 [Mortierella alpina]|nr:hypothetical protein EC968_004830 [Mortierella alpina]
MSNYPSQPPPVSDGKTPHVLIVGAGLAGLLLAILLDRAKIPYEIYERANEIKPLGALMSLNASILTALDQLGLLEELEKVSLPNNKMTFCSDDLKVIGAFEVADEKEILGYDRIAFSRPELYDLLASKISPEKLHFGKKVMSVAQNKDGIMIRCSDGTTYHGDILVGADGAYSGVRQGLYKLLQQEGQLPPSDSMELSKGFICMVGTTDPLDPAKYPGLTDSRSNAYQVIGKGSQYTWSAFSVPENKICWNVVVQLTSVQHEDEKFRNSEWGPESNDALIKEVENFKTPYNCTMGDLIAQTPRERISKVFLEDKLFETWHAGRTVLIGDAAHKLLPSAGQGAVTAMQDSVVLANCLYELQSLDCADITAALQDFKDQRYPHVKEQYDASKMNAKIVYGQTFFERTIRHVVFNYMPKSVQMKNVSKGTANRPQALFLPFVPKRGTCPVIAQKPSKRYLEEQEMAKIATATAV